MGVKNIVVIGGGTGTFVVLSGLKKYTQNLTAIVNMTDSGSSTGILRDELGVLPSGDIRQCLIALSNSDYLLRQIFNYRFKEGGLIGHNFGNLFLAALEKITGSFDKAVREAGNILSIRGKVIPVTIQNVHFCAKLKNGKVVCGEREVSKLNFFEQPIKNFFLRPKAAANLEAIKAIKKADIIVIGPGNLYSSLVPIFLTNGVAEAIRISKAKKIYNCNLMTKPSQTDNYQVHDFAEVIEKYLGGPVLNFVTFNSRKPPDDLIKKYAAQGEKFVNYDFNILKNKHYLAVPADLVSKKIWQKPKGDIFIKRTLVRHNPNKLAELILALGEIKNILKVLKNRISL